jgi:hypothetical protein
VAEEAHVDLHGVIVAAVAWEQKQAGKQERVGEGSKAQYRRERG